MQKRIDTVNRVLREQLTGIRVVRAFVREKVETDRFDAGQPEPGTQTALRAGRLFALMFPLVMLIMYSTIGRGAVVRRVPHQRRHAAGRHAECLHGVHHPDPRRRHDGVVHVDHDSARRGLRRPHQRGAVDGVERGAAARAR